MLDSNTLQTVLGYCRSLVEKRLGFNCKRPTVAAIYNYHQTEIGLNTSGQPTAKQFEAIKNKGVEVVINLAPSSAENSLQDEQKLVESMSMFYVHIPVDFRNPREEDFSQFVAILEQYSYPSLWIHCAANMRVSAFLYRYRVQILKHKKSDAIRDLYHIWKPFGVWRRFLEM